MRGTEITPGNALERLSEITDPIQRAWACDDLLRHAIPELQAAVAKVRRQAVYDATLRPGWTAGTVAEELGVGLKAISKAVSEQRLADRTLMARALEIIGVDSATTTRDVPLMARRLVQAVSRIDVDQFQPDLREAVRRAQGRAEEILDGHDLD